MTDETATSTGNMVVGCHRVGEAVDVHRIISLLKCRHLDGLGWVYRQMLGLYCIGACQMGKRSGQKTSSI
jgi:hypothetical protein